jgi:hypothetical protein
MYVVVENTPGYLPEDDDPGTFEDLADAQAYAAERAESYLDELDPEELDKPEVSKESETLWRISWPHHYTLDRVVEILEVFDGSSIEADPSKAQDRGF